MLTMRIRNLFIFVFFGGFVVYCFLASQGLQKSPEELEKS